MSLQKYLEKEMQQRDEPLFWKSRFQLGKVKVRCALMRGAVAMAQQACPAILFYRASGVDGEGLALQNPQR